MYSEEWKKDVDTDLFWSIVELARSDNEIFKEKMKTLDRRTLIWFSWYFEELASCFGQEKFMKYTNPDYSEDSLDDLWEEVVGRGKMFYEGVLKKPETIPKTIDRSDSSHLIKYDVSNIFYKRYREEIPPVSYDY